VAISPDHQHEFGPFRLDLTARLLFRDGRAISLPPKAYGLLALLAGNPGRAMSKSEIIAALWPDTEVEEGSLSFQISTLRKTLGPEGSKWIETVPRHGYRFRAPSALETPSAPDLFRRRPKRRMWIAAAGFVAVVTGGSLMVRSREPVEPSTSTPLTTYRGSETAPVFSPDGQAVAFMWDQGQTGNWDIYVKLPEAEVPLQFTSTPEAEFSPSWSPDGRGIAFARRLSPTAAQYIIKPYPDGPERILMTAKKCIPSAAQMLGQIRILTWHPDGRHLIIPNPEEDRSCGLAVLSIATGTIDRLTEPPPSEIDFAPAVSREGRKLAFVRGVGFPKFVLYAIGLSQDVKAEAAAWKVTSDTARMELGPAWMPDSKELVFSSGTSIADLTLFRVDASGGGKPRALPAAGPMAFWPSVSARGSLVFSTEMPGKASTWRVELPEDAGGGLSLSEIAPSSLMQQMAAYSPDGQRIVFESERSGEHEIWSVGISGSSIRQLTRLAAIAQSPAWSPDGSRIAFSAAPNRQRDLYVVGANGGTPRRLTEDPSDDAGPSWSHDGRWLYFHSNRSGAYQVWRMPAEGGPAAQITRMGGMQPMESPDREFVYYRKGERLWRLPLAGDGAESMVLEGVGQFNNVVLVDNGVFFLSAPAANETMDSRIRFHDLTTGRTRDVAALPGLVGWGLSVSRDRRTFLVTRKRAVEADLRTIRRL
jgi:Tol biopolymer transport system component/DNA-binding winged helix-turn-helix (wHTH) protein